MRDSLSCYSLNEIKEVASYPEFHGSYVSCCGDKLFVIDGGDLVCLASRSGLKFDRNFVDCGSLSPGSLKNSDMTIENVGQATIDAKVTTDSPNFITSPNIKLEGGKSLKLSIAFDLSKYSQSIPTPLSTTLKISWKDHECRILVRGLADSSVETKYSCKDIIGLPPWLNIGVNADCTLKKARYKQTRHYKNARLLKDKIVSFEAGKVNVYSNSGNFQILATYKYDLPSVITPIPDYLGNIYLSNVDKFELTKMDVMTGKQLWTYKITKTDDKRYGNFDVLPDNGKIYVMTSKQLRCIDGTNGKQLWEFAVKGGEEESNDESNQIPISFGSICVDGGKVFVPVYYMNRGFVLNCIDGNSGNILWASQNISMEFYYYSHLNGTYLYADKILVYSGFRYRYGGRDYMNVFNKTTGELEYSIVAMPNNWLVENGMLRTSSGYYEINTGKFIIGTLDNQCMERIGNLVFKVKGYYNNAIFANDIVTGETVAQINGSRYIEDHDSIAIVDGNVFIKSLDYSDNGDNKGWFVFSPIASKIEYQSGSANMKADGKNVVLKVRPEITNGNFYIPVLSLCEQTGNSVSHTKQAKEYGVHVNGKYYFFTVGSAKYADKTVYNQQKTIR